MYFWKGRGKLEFVWASSGSGSTPPATAIPPAVPAEGNKSAAAGETVIVQAKLPSLWVTVIPPEVLDPKATEDPHKKVSEDVELSSKALAVVIGKGGAALKALEQCTGVVATAQPHVEGESHRRLRLEGTKKQIADAQAAIDQQIVLRLGEKAVEKKLKHAESELLARKRTETGAEAANAGVPGLSEFAETWKLSGVMARKVSRLDAMLQRYLIRHFKPWKAKPMNALRAYIVALLKHPQRWRLEALSEAGELDGELCETIVVSPEHGAVVGRQRKDDGHCDEPAGEHLIELEYNEALGERAARIFGNVQPRHCRLLRMGSDFYAWAQDSQTGTFLDGHKYRERDGPVPVRDGSVIAVGKYLLYCEVGDPAFLQKRRARLLEGERFWKLGEDLVQAAEQQGPTEQLSGGQEEDLGRGSQDDDEEDEQENPEEANDVGTSAALEERAVTTTEAAQKDGDAEGSEATQEAAAGGLKRKRDAEHA